MSQPYSIYSIYYIGLHICNMQLAMQFPVFTKYAGSPEYAALVPLKEGEGYTLPGDSGTHLLSAKVLPTCCTMGVASGGGRKIEPSYQLGGQLHDVPLGGKQLFILPSGVSSVTFSGVIGL